MSRMLIYCIIFAITIGAVGCSKKKQNTTAVTTKPVSEPTAKQSQSSGTVQKISDNPGFFTAKAVAPAATEAKDLDKLIRPVMANIFEDAKLVEESKAPQTKVDGEVVENRLVYVVRMLLTMEEGDNLHAALKAKGFVSSPRLGSKPTHIKGHSKVMMSLMKSTRLRGYSLVIIVDAANQKIEIESYKLGSKYDRMM